MSETTKSIHSALTDYVSEPSLFAELEASGRESDPPVADIVDLRYRIVSSIGQGGMGTVFLVEDISSGQKLALKRIRPDRADPKSVLILRNEYLALAPLRHPNVATVHDFGYDWRSQEYYFTSEYVDGRQLLKATADLDPATPAGCTRLINIMVQILRALEFVHSRGLVHGDLKPENVLVARESSREVAKVIDFGLTKREKDFGGKRIFGTSFYIAPETILGSQVDRRTDLYSLGVVFYQLVTRKLPFVGSANLVILKGHLEGTPVSPREIVPSLPEALSSIILRMMEKRPSDRYASAAEVIADVGRRFGKEFPLETPETANAYLSSIQTVGQEAHVRELHAFFHIKFRVAALIHDDDLNLSFLGQSPVLASMEDLPEPPAGHFFLIRGEKGIGKRRLIDDFQRYVSVRGVPFIDLAVSGEKASRHVNLRRLLEFLARTFSRDEARRELALLKLVDMVADIEDPDAGKMKSAVDRLAETLVEACVNARLVIHVARLDLAEEPFLEFLRALVRRLVDHEGSSPRLLILATARDEELDSPALRRLLLSQEIRKNYRELSMERLNLGELESVIDEIFGRRRFSRDFLLRLYEETDGNPGVLHEILTALIQKRRIVRTDRGWAYTGNIQSEVFRGKKRRELKSQIQKLDADAKRLGLAFAFLGNSCELELATRLAGIQPGKILSALLTLKRSRLVREDGEGTTDTFSLTHQSARELFQQLISEPEKEKIHLRAGELLEERRAAGKAVDPRHLAFHFLRAGAHESGVRYGLMTARLLAQKQLPRKALELYREVRELCRDGVEPIPDLDYQIASLEAIVGNTKRAAKILKHVLSTTREPVPTEDGPVTRARILVELGNLECRLGNFRGSGKLFQRAYKNVKGGKDSPQFLELLLGFATLFYYRGDAEEGLKYCERVEASLDRLPGDVSRGALFRLLAECHHRLGDDERAVECCQRGLVRMDAIRDVGGVAFNLFLLGKMYVFRGKFEQARRQFQLCARVFQRIGVRTLEADSLHECGAAHLLAHSPGRAGIELQKALEIYETTGHAWGRVESLKLLAEVYRRLGRYEEADGFLSRAEKGNDRLGGATTSCDLEVTRARILIDRGHFERTESCLEQLDQAEPAWWHRLEEVVLTKLELQCRLALARGDYRRVQDITALGMIHARDVQVKTRVAPLLELRAKLYFLLGRPGEVRRQLTLLSEIGAAHDQPVLIARAQRLEARLAHSTGDYLGASELFEKALATFREQESERDLAELYYDYGMAQLDGGNHERSYVLFEEGAYLSKKLNQVHLRCRFLTAMGMLESRIEGSKLVQARNHYQAAERLARKFEFKDLLWQILYRSSRLLLDHGQREIALPLVHEAIQLYYKVLSRIPESFRESYSVTTEGNKLLEVGKVVGFAM